MDGLNGWMRLEFKTLLQVEILSRRPGWLKVAF